ncbi:hypothetical protein A7M65_19545 [Acinetobacter baumannii]|nr:hypothetical protein A7M65_19545 [Acinetobacter baumannii]
MILIKLIKTPFYNDICRKNLKENTSLKKSIFSERKLEKIWKVIYPVLQIIFQIIMNIGLD